MGPFLLFLVLFVVVVVLVLRGSVHRRPERWALVLGVLIVGIGSVAAVVEVADSAINQRVTYQGKLDADEVLNSFNPPIDGKPVTPSPDYGYLSAAEGEMTVPDASAEMIVFFALGTLLPWALAVFVLARIVPILRAAERRDPFRHATAQRLWKLGGLLLVGVPAIVFIQFGAATAAQSKWIAPTVEPTLTLSPLHLLPGVIVLALAGIFWHGAELRDFEQHAV